MKKVKSLEMTCGACPSQWEGEFEDDSPVYIRYRWGYLGVYDIAFGGTQLFGKQVGDGLHGVMTAKEMLQITGLEFMEKQG